MSVATRRTFTAIAFFGSLGGLPIALTGDATAQTATSQASRTEVDRLLAGGHYLRAEQPIRAALQSVPNDAHLLNDLSVVDWAFNRFDAAIVDAEKAVAASPNSAEAHSKLADAVGAKLAASAADPGSGTFAKLSLSRRFRKELDRTLELDPNDEDALEDLARFYWHAPGFVGGDQQKARQTSDRLFQVSASRGATARADFAESVKDVNQRNAEILRIWRVAASAQPDSYDAHAALAAAYLREPAGPSQLIAAEMEAKRALALAPSRIGAYSVLAVVYVRASRWNELEWVLKLAGERVPDDRAPDYLAAVAILAANDVAKMQLAEQLLRGYLAQRPEGQAPSHASAHWRLGQVLERQGRRAEALRELQTAVQQDGSLEEAKKEIKQLS